MADNSSNDNRKIINSDDDNRYDYNDNDIDDNYVVVVVVVCLYIYIYTYIYTYIYVLLLLLGGYLSSTELLRGEAWEQANEMILMMMMIMFAS